jgi:hypothetical protein
VCCGLAAASASASEFGRIAREVGGELGLPDGAGKDGAVVVAPKNAEGFVPEVKVIEGNPYLQKLYTWTDEFLKRTPVKYGPSNPEKVIFNATGGRNPDYGSRTEMAIAKNLFWLVTHPESRYQGNEELFRRMLRRVVCYANDYNMHCTEYRQHLNDFFAVGPAAYNMRSILVTYGDFLTPAERESLDQCLKKMGRFWFDIYQTENKSTRYSKAGHYANRDIAVANILLNTGMYLNDAEYLAAAKDLIYAQKRNQYPDGAFAYIGTQNECAGYHWADVLMLTRYWVLTQDPEVESMLKKSRSCVLLSNEKGGLGEFYTAPSWKHAWNFGNYATHESVVYFTDNPYLRSAREVELQRLTPPLADALSIPFYTNHIAPKPLPDNITIRDRNIAGVRARYGDWSMAGTLRRVEGEDEPGLATLVGAMNICRGEKGDFLTDSILMFARPEALTPNGQWAYLTDELQSEMKLGRDFSALAAVYNMHTSRSSTKGTVTPWQGEQMWLTVRDRMFGILAVEPQEETEAKQLAVTLRLGYAGFRTEAAKEIERIDDRNFRYGQFHLRIIDTNFLEFEIQRNQVREAGHGAYAADLRLTTAEQAKQYVPGQRYYAVVELYPIDTQTKVASCDCTGAEISATIDGKNYVVRHAGNGRLSLETDDKSHPWDSLEELLSRPGERALR